MKSSDFIKEAANPAQQAAIAIAMKKAGKKPENEAEIDERFTLPKRLGTKRDRFKSLRKEAVKDTGPKFTGYFKGQDKPPVGRRLVGETIEVGDIVRTQDMSRRGIVESIELYRPFGSMAVYFRDNSGTLLRTPIANVIKVYEDSHKIKLTEEKRLFETLSRRLESIDPYSILVLFEAATTDVQGQPNQTGQQLASTDNKLYQSIKNTLASVSGKIKAMAGQGNNALEQMFDNNYYSAKESLLAKLPAAAQEKITAVFGKLEQAAKSNPKIKHPLIIAASTAAAIAIPSVGGSALAIAGIVAVLNLVFGNTPYKSVLTGLSSGALAGVLGWAAHSLPHMADLLPDWAGDIGSSMQSAAGHKVIKGAELAAHHEIEHPGIVSKTVKGIGNTASSAIQGLRNFAGQAAQARASGIGR